MTEYKRGGYRVIVADDGAIKVRRGDILGGYSMAIYGNPRTFSAFVRMGHGGRPNAILNPNLIYTGETLYHWPTRQKFLQGGKVTRIQFDEGSVVTGQGKTSGNISDAKKKQIQDLIKDRHKLTSEQVQKLDSILSRISDVAAFIDLLSTLGVLGSGAGAVAGLAGIPLFAISAAIALYDASNFDRTLYGMVCVGYTYTAWAFGDRLPSRSNTFLKRTHFTWRMAEYNRVWVDTQRKVLAKLRTEIIKRKLRENDVQAAMRIIMASSNRQKLYQSMIGSFVKGMAGKPTSHVGGVKALASYIYPN